jgi:hypothetical protein
MWRGGARRSSATVSGVSESIAPLDVFMVYTYAGPTGLPARVR